jgi:hypothetical protein
MSPFDYYTHAKTYFFGNTTLRCKMNRVGRWIAPIAAAAALAFAGTGALAATDAKPLVDAEWVHQHKDNPNVVVLDVRNDLTGDTGVLNAGESQLRA